MIANVAAPTLIRTVTAHTFPEAVLQAAGPAVVEFMSYGCSHCRALEPVLQRVASELDGHQSFLRVNVAVEQGLADEYGVVATPTLILFRNGGEIGRLEGPRPQFASLLEAVTEPFAR